MDLKSFISNLKQELQKFNKNGQLIIITSDISRDGDVMWTIHNKSMSHSYGMYVTLSELKELKSLLNEMDI